MQQNKLSIYAKSFNWAGYFLPKSTYYKCSCLYDFCRTVDDIADNKGDLNKKKLELNNFKKRFYEKDFTSNNIKNMWKLINEFSISTKIIDDLFIGVETDLQDKVEIKNTKDLLIYSYRVAGTVGLMMAKILNVNSKNALKSAIDLGVAMQLTNIARDVVEDSKRNRKYIDHNFSKIKETLRTADTFYESSFKAIREIPLNCRFAILVARRVYREIGNVIKKKKDLNEYNLCGKIYVSKIGKIKQTVLSIIDFFILIFTKQESYSKLDNYLDVNKEINLNERF